MGSDEQDIDVAIQDAIDDLPTMIKPLVEEVPVRWQQEPWDELATDMGHEILGVFIGSTRSEMQAGLINLPQPPVIWLFRGPLHRACDGGDSFHEQVAVTLRHELAHYLDQDEEGVAGLGLA